MLLPPADMWASTVAARASSRVSVWGTDSSVQSDMTCMQDSLLVLHPGLGPCARATKAEFGAAEEKC